MSRLLLASMASSDSYSGIVLSFSPAAIVATFVEQVFAPIPLSWFWGRCARFVFSRTEPLHLRDVFYILVFLGLAVLFLYSLLNTLKKKSPFSYVSFIGLLIWLLPAIPIALSAKYQSELTLMNGYLPRYLQSFGLALFVIPILHRGGKRYVLIIILLLLTLITFTYNSNNIQNANREYNAFRVLFYTLLDTEFLDGQGVRRIYVNRKYVFNPSAYPKLNPEVTIIDKQQLMAGDNVLFIKSSSRGKEWAYWGKWNDDGNVSDIYLVKNYKDDEIIPVNAVRMHEWYFSPSEKIYTMEELLELMY
ncbi:hypothetical protein ACFL3A_00280 [Pseudomonadota bacterium]